MPITLGAITFDDATTAVKEKLEEVGGRNERRVTISGLVTGLSNASAIESALDGILDAASLADYSAELRLRDGRRLWVRRETYRREVRADDLVGSFTLELGARDAIEESVAESITNWPITASGTTLNTASAGNVYSRPVITLVAIGTLVDPAVSDGARTVSYSGMVADGETLVFDAVANAVLLEGTDVTPYTTGEFPRIAPEGTTLTYSDDASSSHTATGTVGFRDRWW